LTIKLSKLNYQFLRRNISITILTL